MSSRDERRQAAIRQRREGRRQLQQRYRRNQQIKRWSLIGGTVLLVALLAWGGYTVITNQMQEAEDENLLDGVATFELTAGHVADPVTYDQNPPAGGPHFNAWQNCGYYDAPLVSENAVHSLEHGAVWVTYRPDLPQEQVDALREKAEGQTYVLVAPYPDLPAPVVASAWGNQLQFESADDPALDAFLRTYRQSSDAPEPGAPCTGGISTTR